MFTTTIRAAVLATAAAGLVLTGASTAGATPPAGPAAQHHTIKTPAARRILLGTFSDNGDHNYFPTVRTGTYRVQYAFTVGGATNTWIGATQPHIVPLPNGRYLGQVGGGADQTVTTPVFTLNAGTHRITSQSPELYGPVTVYLKPVTN